MPAPPVAELTGMRWPEVENGPRRLLVVPAGSLEQHGPHLPLDTDTRIAVAVARRACADRPGVALAPAFAIGASGEHAAFPGTLSIGEQALTACLIELGRHASLHWAAVLLVNGHGGNVPAVEAAAGRLRYEGRARQAWDAAARPGTPGCPAVTRTPAGPRPRSCSPLTRTSCAWTRPNGAMSGRSARSCRCSGSRACGR